MYLIPTPQKVAEKSEILKKRTVKLMNEPGDARLVKAAEKLPIEDDGIALYITYKETKTK